MMNIFSRVNRSVSFRYKNYRKNQQQKKVNRSKERHRLKMEKINATKFSIISANCWGGSVYEDVKQPYLTPTVGLFFYAPDFIKLLKDPQKYMSETPVFIDQSKYMEVNQFRIEKYAYPIGLLGSDVEIQFLHYKTKEEAMEKWERRKQRIVWDNLYVACTDRDGMTRALMEEFDHLPYRNKVIFTAKRHDDIKCAVQIKAYSKKKVVGDLYNQRYTVSPDFDISSWLQSL